MGQRSLLNAGSNPAGLNGYSPLELLKESSMATLQREASRMGGGMISDPNMQDRFSFSVMAPPPSMEDMMMGGEQVMGMMPMAGIFVGVGAKSANKAMLKKAKSMASQGAGRKEIWGKTGWFKDADNQWKYEINDREASFNKLRSEDGLLYRNENVGQAYDHPEAVESYAGLENINIRRSAPPNSGAYSKDKNYISIGHHPLDPKNTALHELQHAIQDKANFARGGSTEGVWSSGQYNDELARAMEIQLKPMSFKAFSNREFSVNPFADNLDMGANYADYLESLSLWKSQNNPLDYIHSPAQVAAGRDIYKRLGGEVEARNVERRMNFTPKQRTDSPPWETRDVKEDQIINTFYAE